MKEFKNYLRILGYLKPHKWLVLVAIFSSFLVASSFAGAIGGIKPVVDLLQNEFKVEDYNKLPLLDTPWGNSFLLKIQEMSTQDKFQILVYVAMGIIGIMLVRSFFKFTHGYVSSYLSSRLRMDVAIDLHDKVMNQSLAFFSKEGVGATISVFNNDITLIHRGAKIIFDKLFLEPPTIIFALGLAFYFNARLALIAIIGLPIVGITAGRLGQKIKKNTRRSLKNMASILSLLQESLFGIKIVKSFVMEDYERKRFHAENKRLLKNIMRRVMASELMSPVVEVVAALGIGVFLLLGGRDLISGKMSSGDFIAFYAALGSVFGPLRRLSKALGEVQTSLAGAKRTFEFMDKLPDIKDPPDAAEAPPIKGNVVFDNVSFSYNGTQRVINDVSFEAKPGEMIAFVGVSGAGKSTLANLLLRFYDPMEGGILIDGFDIRSVKQASLRSQIGLVTQETILFNDSIANNISFGDTDFSREKIIAAAKAANAHGFIQELSEGYDTIIGERGMLLSGGQRQRIAISRTILKNPAIFVLDEATSSLDSETEFQIQQALARLIEGRTTFVIAHRLSTIKNADKVIVLDKGRIEAIGTHETLLDDSPIYRTLYEKQALAPPEPTQ